MTHRHEGQLGFGGDRRVGGPGAHDRNLTAARWPWPPDHGGRFCDVGSERNQLAPLLVGDAGGDHGIARRVDELGDGADALVDRLELAQHGFGHADPIGPERIETQVRRGRH